MRRVVAFFVRTPIWVNVLMFSILIFGALTFSTMRFSFFPEVEPNTIQIEVAFPGASPSEVAEGVILKIEEQLDGLEGVERVTSVARESFGVVSVETIQGSDLERVTTDVKNAVDRINSFPMDAEKPVIYQAKFMERALSIVISGETDLYNLKEIAEDFRDELLATPEISLVRISGLPALEFSIEVSEEALRRHDLSFDQVSAAVARHNLNISGGKFDTREEEILIRAWGCEYHASELGDIPIRANPGGTPLRLDDIASIREQWADVPDRVWFNGRTAVVLTVDQAAEEDILLVAEKARQLAADFDQREEGLSATVRDDRTVPLRQRIDLLARNGGFGLILVLITLGLFLKLRVAFWAALGIPISFAGMFIILNLWGITINVISLFGMIIVVGILVDDAIVVAENIFAQAERGVPPLKAAVNGTMEVLAPVATSVTTTILAFTPLFFLVGFLGQMIWQVAAVVIFALVFSLVEAFFILPMHLGHSKALSPESESGRIRKKLEAAIAYLTHRIYGPTLRLALRNKWVTLTIPISAVLITFGLLKSGIIGFTYFPFLDSDRISVGLSLTVGSQEEKTTRFLERVEAAAWELNDELKAERADGLDVVTGVQRELGSGAGESGSHAGSVTLLLLDGETRDMEQYLIANRLRELVGPMPDVRKISFGASGRFGTPVSISLLGDDGEDLRRARDLLVAELQDFSSLKDVTDSEALGRRELEIKLKPKAAALGLTLRDVAGQVRQGFFGQEIQRIQRGRDEIRVWIRYRPEDRGSLGYLDAMRIRTADGRAYPFSELAEYSISRGVSVINRLDRMQEIRVEAAQADVTDDLPPILAEIENEVLPRIREEVPGIFVSFEGQSRSQSQEMGSMAVAFPLALLGMFLLVVLVFRSYVQAGLIFSLIPLGILGAVWGHGIQGMQVNMLSLYGVIALSGIIINDSIVFVDQINRYLRDGRKLFDAVYDAGIARLRPILLTTMTTALGLAPLMLEKSRQAQFLKPMAASVAYGLLFGTFILLIILPTGYLAINRLRLAWARGVQGEKEAVPESVEPAVRELTMPVVE